MKDLTEKLFKEHSEEIKEAMRPIVEAALKEAANPEYYTPEPGEDPHLPPGTLCEVKGSRDGDWHKEVFGCYLGCFHGNSSRYFIKSGGVYEQIRFRLSDIQDRGEKMVGKMVMAWQKDDTFFVIGMCEGISSSGLYIVSYMRDGSAQWAHYDHTRLYCEGWKK